MPLYRCPKCGRTVEKPEGAYYCKVCGRDAIMQKLEVNPSKPLKLRWVEDDAGIYWTATKDFLHALYYDEEDKVYVWYIFDWADWEDVKRGRLFVPIYSYKVIETTDLEEAKDKVLMGTERKSLLISDEEKRSTAYHLSLIHI